MFRYLHGLSATAFYVLGTCFFVAFILLRNDIAATGSAAFMEVGDLPLLFSGLLYGGLSVYGSIKDDSSSSKILMLGLLIPLAIIFLLAAAVNFQLL